MAVETKKNTSKKPRVLYVNLEGAIAGAERSLLTMIQFMPAGFDISAACPAGQLPQKLRSLGVRTYRISTTPRKYNYFFTWFFYFILVNFQLALIVLRQKPQIIHANSDKATLATGLAGLLTKCRTIRHQRDIPSRGHLVKAAGYLSAGSLAVSRFVKDRLVSLGEQEAAIKIIHNSVEAEALPVKTRTKNPDRPFTFANVSQFVPWKKHFLFIEAAEAFLRAGWCAKFLLIGDDVFGRDRQYKASLVERVVSSPFASHIKTIAWQADMSCCWNQIDCLVHTAENEPFGRVLIEAMAQRIPVIAPASGGPGEIINPGRTGLLFAANDLKDLLVNMKRIYRDKKLIYKLTENASRYVSGRFSAKKNAKRIAKIYDELISA